MNTYSIRNYLFIVIMILLFIMNLKAQNVGGEFIIAPNYYANGDFKIDRLTQQLYFSFNMGRNLKVDLQTGAIDTTQYAGYVGAVAFSNMQHLMYNSDTLYNLENDYRYALIPPDTIYNSSWHFYPYFSPNDSNLMFSILYPGQEPNPTLSITNNFIFSLKDSSFIPIDSAVQSYSGHMGGYGSYPQWSSDSSFVYPLSDSAIAEYFIRSRRIDTLVSLHKYSKIVSFAYNMKENILSYSASIWVDPDFSERVYFHKRDSGFDYLVFSPARDDSSCDYFGGVLTFLCWSPNKDRLGFLLFDPINRHTTVYFYSLNSSCSYELTSCNNYGLKYFLKWANEDTVVYLNATEGHLYGINISNIDGIRENIDNNNMPINFGLNNYPNPFNPSTTFEILLPSGKDATLSIYNIQGKLIKEYNIKNDGRTKYGITWNALNNKGRHVATGIYIAVLKLRSYKEQDIKTSKIVFLK